MSINLLALLLAWAPACARASALISPAAEIQLEEGLQRLYALDYDRSRAAFRRLIELEPDNPWGYLFEAGGIWWQSSQEYGLFQATPTLQGLFEQDVEAALRKSDAYIDTRDPALRAAGYFVSGMARGTRGQWSLMKGQYLAAYFDGKKAVKHFKRCLRIDRDFADAYLGLGVYDYQAAHLSGVARLGVLFGVRGDERRGLERMRRAMAESRYARRQAAQFLSTIYLLDKRDDASALPLIERLRSDFPDSAYFLFLEALLRQRLGDWEGSLGLGRELHRRVEADPRAFERKWLTLVCGLAGPRCLAPGDLETALAWLERALGAEMVLAKAPRGKTPPPSSFELHLRLLRAQVLDGLERRGQAEAEYRRLLRLPAFGDSRERAAACLAEPCTRESLLKRLQELSREE